MTVSCPSSCKDVSDMRICVICKDFDRFNIALQPWRYVFELCRRVSARGAKVQVLSNRPSAIHDSGVIRDLWVKRLTSGLPRPFSREAALLESVGAFRPDVVIWFIGVSAFFYIGWAKRLKAPLVLVLTEEILEAKSIVRLGILDVLRDIGNTWSKIVSMLCPRMLIVAAANSSAVSKVVVLNETNRQRLVQMGVAQSKIFVISPGTDAPIERPPIEYERRVRDELGMKGKVFVATYMGPLRRIRGPDIAVEAASILARDHLPVRLIVLSRRTKDDRNLLKKEIQLKSLAKRLGVADKISIISGILDRQTLAAFMFLTDVFVFPFRMIESETPLSPLEAMRIGKPVISSKLGSLEGPLGHRRGILVEPGNAKQLARGMKFLYNRPEHRHAMAQKAKSYMNGWPSWDEVTDRMTMVLRQVIERENRPIRGRIHRTKIPGFLCLIGPDGTGKTAHARRLVLRLTTGGIRCRYRWFRAPRFATLGVFALSRLINLTHITDKSRRLSEHAFFLNQAVASLVPWVQTLDTIVYALVKLYMPHWMGLKIVSDRFVHDIIVDLTADTRIPIVNKKVGKILMGLIPRDCAVVLLDADNGVIMSRKSDVPSQNYLVMRKRIYADLADLLGIPVVKSNSSFESTQELIESKLLSRPS